MPKKIIKKKTLPKARQIKTLSALTIKCFNSINNLCSYFSFIITEYMLCDWLTYRQDNDRSSFLGLIVTISKL